MLARNPAAVKRNTLPRKLRKRSVYLSHAEVDALAAAAGEYAPLVQFLCATGLRWVEATGLRVRDLDLLRGRATIHENAVRTVARSSLAPPRAASRETFRYRSTSATIWPPRVSGRDATSWCGATA
jgi:integrase